MIEWVGEAKKGDWEMINEEVIFEIILHGGNARADAYEALKAAQEGDFERAKTFLKRSEKEIGIAHRAQSELIQQEAKGPGTTMTMLMVHAQDHLMTAIAEKGLIENMIDLYQRINRLEHH